MSDPLKSPEYLCAVAERDAYKQSSDMRLSTLIARDAEVIYLSEQLTKANLSLARAHAELATLKREAKPSLL